MIELSEKDAPVVTPAAELGEHAVIRNGLDGEWHEAYKDLVIVDAVDAEAAHAAWSARVCMVERPGVVQTRWMQK